MVGNGAAAGTHEDGHVLEVHAVGQGQEVVPRAVVVEGGRRLVLLLLPLPLDGRERLLRAVHVDRAAELLGKQAHAVHPQGKARLELGLRRHHEVEAAHRVERNDQAADDHLPLDGGEEVGAQFAEEGVAQALLLVQADDEVGNGVFLHRVADAAHHVHAPTVERLYLHIGRSGEFLHAVQLVVAFLAGGRGTLQHHVERQGRHHRRGGAEQQREVDELGHGVGIVDGQQQAVGRIGGGLEAFGRGLAAEHHAARRALGDERTHHAAHQDEDHGAIEHILAQQVGAVGQDDAVAHQHHGQRGGCTRAGEAEHEAALVGRHAKQALRGGRGAPFAQQPDGHHHGGHHESVDVLEQRAHIDDHAHADEKIGDEQGIAHKLDVAHQGRGGGNEAVEHDAHEEGTEDAFHAHQLHQSGSGKHEGEHEHVLHDALVVAAEEPAPQARKGIDDHGAEGHHLHHEPHPVESAHVVLEHTAHHGQHKQRERVGHDGAAHGQAHTREARQAVAEHDGIGYEGVRGIHGGHQHGGRGPVAEQPAVGRIAQGHRDEETQQAEGCRLAADALHVLQVHLERGEKHDVVDAHLAKQLEAAVALKHMQAVGPDEDAGENHPHDGGDAQAFQEHRRKEDDAQHDEEDPGGVGDGQCVQMAMDFWEWGFVMNRAESGEQGAVAGSRGRARRHPARGWFSKIAKKLAFGLASAPQNKHERARTKN